MRLTGGVAFVFLAGCSLYMPIETLPEKPVRAHRYYDFESVDVPVLLPGRPTPIRIHCKVAGEGPPLLLIHGLMTSGYSWRYVIADLARHYRVIVPDLPGAPRSDAPPDLSMSPESVAGVLAGLIDAMNLDRPHVVGNSMGGYEALWLAVLHPGKVRTLVVMHAPVFPRFKLGFLQFILALPGGEALLRAMATKNPEGFVAKNIHYHDSSVMSREETREYGAIFRNEAQTRIFTRIMRETLSARGMRDLHERLRPSNLPPTLLLWASEDVMVPPAFGPRLHDLLPGSELVWIENSSHFLQVDAPERTVAEILRFCR